MLNVTPDRHARLSRARGRMARGSHHYLQSKFGSAIKGEAIKSAQGKEGARQGRGRVGGRTIMMRDSRLLVAIKRGQGGQVGGQDK